MHWGKWIVGWGVSSLLLFTGNQVVLGVVGTDLVTADTEITNEKQLAIADVNTNLNIRSGPGVTRDIVGKIPPGGWMEVHGYENGWCEITSGEVTGYVNGDYLCAPRETEARIAEVGLENLPVAASLSQYRQEAITGIGSFSNLSLRRQQLIEYASQFIGNPYVWGGTSLTEGTDCSGYVQSIYREFGVELPRVSRNQANVGERLSVETAEPGDLIFYAKEGVIYHVVINLGDGKVLGASGAAKGICISNLDSTHAVWATNVLG